VTRPPVGEVFVDVHANTDKVDPEMEAGLKKAAAEADDELDDVGKKWGKTLGDAMEKELEKNGPDLARSVQRGVDRERVVSKVVVEYDSEGNASRRWVTTVARDLERKVRDSVSGSGATGGPFSKVSQAISDAIGAGFNISGRSPLIAFLVPLVGFIGELIVGAIQGASALVPVLLSIPGLIGAIAIQAGVLLAAFQGVGTAIQGAFAAKNADELKKALEGLTPAAQAFVKSLLPMKDFLKAVQDIAQEKFFVAFGNSIDVMVKALGGIVYANIGGLADALGNLGRTIVTFFADPTFTRFFIWLFSYTVKWVNDFSTAIESFLRGLANIGYALMPFMDWLGEGLNDALRKFGDYLSNLSTDQDFLTWVDHMKSSLSALGDVLKAALGVVVNLADSIDKAGGEDTLKNIAEQLTVLGDFLKSDVAVKGIEGLVHALELLSVILIGNVITVFALFAAFETIAEWLKNTFWPWITDFFSNTVPEFFESVGHAIMTFFTWVGEGVSALVKAIGQFFADLLAWIIKTLFDIAGWITTHVHDWAQAIIDFFTGIPTRVKDAVGDLKDTLVQAGKNLVQGLIDGALSMAGPLGGAMGWLAQKAKDYFNHSPAKEGPLAGRGDPFYSGQEFVQRLAAGMTMEAPVLAAASNNLATNIYFGPGSVQQGFYGAPPTGAEAARVGNGAGNGIADALARRDVRLAVRAMA